MKRIFLLISILILITGCMTVRKQGPTADQYYKAKIAALENQIQHLQKKIDLLENEKNEAKTESEKNAILSELSSLSNKQKENINYLEQIKKDIYDIKSKLNNKNNSSNNSGTYANYRKKRIYKRPVIKKTVTKKDLYSQCYSLYSKGKFSAAEKCFSKFIYKYPKNDLVSNAYFWIGETYFERKKFTKAIDYYDIILTKFLNSEKIPAALLKEGLSFYNLHDREGAKIFLEKVISDYPNTPQATYAKKYLEKYKL